MPVITPVIMREHVCVCVCVCACTDMCVCVVKRMGLIIELEIPVLECWSQGCQSVNYKAIGKKLIQGLSQEGGQALSRRLCVEMGLPWILNGPLLICCGLWLCLQEVIKYKTIDHNWYTSILKANHVCSSIDNEIHKTINFIVCEWVSDYAYIISI